MKSLYDIVPDDWDVKQIRFLANTYSGGTPSRANDDYFIGNIKWVKSSELKNKYLFDTEEKISQEALENSSARLVNENTILFAMYGVTAGDICILKTVASVNQAILAIPVSNEKIDYEFLFYAIKRKSEKLKYISQGGGQPNLNKGIVDKLPIAYPKLQSEQKTIAAILSKVDEAIAAVEESIKSAEKVKKALMQNLLTGKLKPDGTWRSEDEFYTDEKFGKIPKGWEIQQMKNVTNRITDGEHLSPDFQTSGLFLLSAEDINEDGMSFKNAKFVKVEDFIKFRKRCDPEYGDVLIVSRGAGIGRICQVNTDTIFCLMGSVILIKPNNDKVNGSFILQYLKSYKSFLELKKLSGNTAQQAIYLTHLKKLKIPYPTNIHEQIEIANKFEILDKTKYKKYAKIETLKKLKNSLMQNLLTGKIRINTSQFPKEISHFS